MPADAARIGVQNLAVGRLEGPWHASWLEVDQDGVTELWRASATEDVGHVEVSVTDLRRAHGADESPVAIEALEQG
jgi:hypothetical protein